MSQDVVVIIVIVAIRRFKKDWVTFIEYDYLPGLALKHLIWIQHLFWGTERLNLTKDRQFLSGSQDLNTGSLAKTCALKQYAILVICKMMEPAKNKEELESMVWGEISEIWFLIICLKWWDSIKHSRRNG